MAGFHLNPLWELIALCQTPNQPGKGTPSLLFLVVKYKGVSEY